MIRWFKRLKLLFSTLRQSVRLKCRVQGSGPSDDQNVFRFAPELFEIRNEVITELSNCGFDWLSHYSAVDPAHDVYGIEVCGIHDRDDAIAIQRILKGMFPAWSPG